MICQRCGQPVQTIHQGVVTMMGHDPLECIDLLRAEVRKRELETSILLEESKKAAGALLELLSRPTGTLERHWPIKIGLEKAIDSIEKAHV